MWASNYVANLRADALQAKGLELLGHILDFATLRIKCCRQHFMREICTSGSKRGEWIAPLAGSFSLLLYRFFLGFADSGHIRSDKDPRDVYATRQKV